MTSLSTTNIAEAETPVRWPPHAKSWLIGKDLMLEGIGGRRRRGRQRMSWLDGITDSMDVESEWTSGVGDGQGGLACCNSWGRKELDTTEWLNWTELNWIFPVNKKNEETILNTNVKWQNMLKRVERKSKGEVKKIKWVGHSLSVTLSYIILIIVGIKGVIFMCVQDIIAALLLWNMYKTKVQKGISQVVLVVNNVSASAGDVRDTCSIPRSGRSPGGRHGNPLQYSYLENTMDWGTWWATAYGVQRVGHKWRDLACTHKKFRKVRETVCQLQN